MQPPEMMVGVDDVYGRANAVLALADGVDGLLLLSMAGDVADSVDGLYRLDGVGRRFWEAIDGSRTLAQLADGLALEYDVAAGVVRADLTALAGTLLGGGLIERWDRDWRCAPVGLVVLGDAAAAAGTGGMVPLMRAALARGVGFRFRAHGFSMLPFIRGGDVLTVISGRGKPLRRGDVLAFCVGTPASLRVHRLIRVEPDEPSIVCRGDNAGEDDARVDREQVLGRVVRVERDGREIRLGLGWERRWIAGILSRHPLRRLWLNVIRCIVRADRRKR